MCWHRSALRSAAQELDRLGSARWSAHNITDPTALQKRCEFMLDLSIVDIPAAGSDIGPSAWSTLMHSESNQEPASDAMVNGTLWSSNCNTSVQINATTTHLWVYEAKAVNYSFMVTALTFVQVSYYSQKQLSGCAKVQCMQV